jgi:hypothetical protein
MDGDLRFRWTPTTALEFHGSAAIPPGDSSRDDWRLVGKTPGSFDVEALLTGVTHGPVSSVVTGIANESFYVGNRRSDRLRFCLVGLPNYLGTPARFSSSGQTGVVNGRLEFSCDAGTCVVDRIRQVDHLALGYLELTLLALCGYNGIHAQRGWRQGWKGQDEATVPWA